MALLEPEDLAPFADIESAKAQAMIDDAVATATLVAPCLADQEAMSELQLAATKAVLRGAILRWNDSGSGALVQQSAGPFSQTLDTRTSRRGMFWPSEIEQLQDICKGEDGGGGAFAIDTIPTCGVVHADICSINFGALHCSCGAVLTGMFPLYEQSWNL